MESSEEKRREEKERASSRVRMRLGEGLDVFLVLLLKKRSDGNGQSFPSQCEQSPSKSMLLNSSRAAAARPPRAPTRRATAATAFHIGSILRVARADKPSLILARAVPSDDGDSPSSASASSTPTSSPSSSAFFDPQDDETAWLTQFLPFSRLSLDAATWLAANAEREALSPGQKVLVPGAFDSFFTFGG